ncbi:UNVERIFIED_CONTAM: hypothetical protein ACS92_01155 [Bacillus cereus]
MFFVRLFLLFLMAMQNIESPGQYYHFNASRHDRNVGEVDSVGEQLFFEKPKRENIFIFSPLAAPHLLLGHFPGFLIKKVWSDPFMHRVYFSII